MPLIQYLIDQGADPLIKNNKGENLLSNAVTNTDVGLDLIKFLVDKGALLVMFCQ